MRNLSLATAVGLTALLIGGFVVAAAAVVLVAPVLSLFLPGAAPELYGGLTREAPPAT